VRGTMLSVSGMNSRRWTRRPRRAARAGLLAAALAASAGHLFALAAFVEHQHTTATTGGSCGPFVDVLAPTSLQSVTLKFRVDFQTFTDQARVYYTTDGSTPAGSFGVPSGSTQVLTAAYGCTYADLSQGGQIVDVPSAVLPAQPGGTTVKYIVGAWLSTSGAELFANSGTCPTCTACTDSSCANLFSYTVSAAPTATFTRTPTVTKTLPPTATRTFTAPPPTATQTPTATFTATAVPPTETRTRTRTPTATPGSPTETPTITNTPSITPTPTWTPKPTVTLTPSMTATPAGPVQFFALTPCRVADTRSAPGPYGGPPLAGGASRSFVISGRCGVAPTATAVSFNFTVTQPAAAGDLRVLPGGAALPVVSALNWSPGQTRANNAIVALGPSGDITVRVDQASGSVQLIIDVNGYFQ